MHHDAREALTSTLAARQRMGVSLRDRERDARGTYARALLAALESLRRAERRFALSAAAIDAHIEQALVAERSLVRRAVGGVPA